jgi:hypothetical protein
MTDTSGVASFLADFYVSNVCVAGIHGICWNVIQKHIPRMQRLVTCKNPAGMKKYYQNSSCKGYCHAAWEEPNINAACFGQ